MKNTGASLDPTARGTHTHAHIRTSFRTRIRWSTYESQTQLERGQAQRIWYRFRTAAPAPSPVKKKTASTCFCVCVRDLQRKMLFTLLDSPRVNVCVICASQRSKQHFSPDLFSNFTPVWGEEPLQNLRWHTLFGITFRRQSPAIIYFPLNFSTIRQSHFLAWILYHNNKYDG